MKTIAVFGASGATGKEVITEANQRGLTTHSFVRRANKSPKNDLNIEFNGDFDQPELLKNTLSNVDAVVIVLGQRPPYKDIFCANATQKIIQEANELGINRLICQTGALIGNYPENQKAFFKKFGKKFDQSHPEVAADRTLQEDFIKHSELNWTIVKPPRLTNGKKKGHIKCAPDIVAGLFSKIDRKDLASLLVDLSTNHDFEKQVVFVKN
ncbi:MAG: NAD(P)H-binding protein [Crocinitomicaceae bacterium]